MADQALQGLADAYAMIEAIPDAAQKELARDLADIGEIIHEAQQAQAPVATGNLKAGLTVQLLLDELKVRAGLIGIASKRSGKTNLGGLFYGVIVNFGRKAQVVLVQRRKVGAAGLRNRRKRAEDIAATYSLRVTPLPAREFIDVTPRVGPQVDALLADFWARTLSNVPGAA